MFLDTRTVTNIPRIQPTLIYHTFDYLYPYKRVIKLLVVIIKVDHISATHKVVSNVFLERLTPYADDIIGDVDFKIFHD